jgi:hypothetical protein
MAELENIALAVQERRQLDLKEKTALEHRSRQLKHQLPRNYQWLKNWELV